MSRYLIANFKYLSVVMLKYYSVIVQSPLRALSIVVSEVKLRSPRPVSIDAGKTLHHNIGGSQHLDHTTIGS